MRQDCRPSTWTSFAWLPWLPAAAAAAAAAAVGGRGAANWWSRMQLLPAAAAAAAAAAPQRQPPLLPVVVVPLRRCSFSTQTGMALWWPLLLVGMNQRKEPRRTLRLRCTEYRAGRSGSTLGMLLRSSRGVSIEGAGLPVESLFFPPLADVCVEDDGEDDDEDDGHGGATGDAGPFQRQFFFVS